MIFITLGDPFSVNIECIKQLFSDELFFSQLSKTQTTVLIGSYQAWQKQSTKKTKNRTLQCLGSLNQLPEKGVYFYDLDAQVEYDENLPKSYRGRLSRAILAQLEGLSLKEDTAILSCPVDKKLTFAQDKNPGGQTEFFEKLSQKKALMTMSSPELSVGLVTNHLPLSKVTSSLSKELVKSKLSLLCKHLEKFHKNPRVAVCSLNPHCGDGGLFGKEDQSIIEPAMKEALTEGATGACEIFGPLPADTLFWKARLGDYHGVLAIYHDQGLAPMKALYFEKTINISVGLNFLRVSPAHGPASDLFLQGKAQTGGFQESFRVILNYLNSGKQ